MSFEIVSSVRICDGSVTRKGREIFSSDADDFSAFAKAFYKHLGIEYLKFFKMDDLSKLFFLACELLMADHPERAAGKSANTALVIGSKSGSLKTDQLHASSLRDRENYFPSPAVFVYTLPNIMLGEVCIRHGLTGENSCFLMENFDPDFFARYVGHLLNPENYESCISGWVNLSRQGYIAILYLSRPSTAATGQDVFANFDEKK